MLKSTEVHVWTVRLDLRPDDVARAVASLSADERERAARFHASAHRDAYVAARRSLRMLLGRYLRQPPEAIAFSYGANGKPRLAHDDRLHFNVSHSGEIAAFAFADCAVGIDVEAVHRVAEADGIASRYFASEECADLLSLAPAAREAAFFDCWTRKEAFVKASGLGLAVPLDRFRVTLRPGEPARLVHVDNDEAEARRWTLHDLELERGYAAAVAYRDRRRALCVHEPMSARALLANEELRSTPDALGT